MLTSKAKYLLSLLEKVDIRGEEELFEVATLWKSLTRSFKSALEEVLEDLGFQGMSDMLLQEHDTISSVHLFQENVHFVYDEAIAFNRYRNITLRADFYEEGVGSVLNLSAYRQWNRQKEKECMKAGITHENWRTRKAETYFGPSDEPGEFYNNGSSVWKWQAFKAALLDAHFLQGKSVFFHLPTYEKLLVQGQLLELGEIVDKRLRNYEQALLNVFCRKAGISQRELEKQK